ncbi:hypothetical protein CIPAW_03G262100 [Carya illinoinensis]|uniref:Uncharacterized protein n=1 Tax=Carya illinoinensis TaxID=32201 RepID=A0A8T1R8A6_CARIL|nr:hypothetical protein CIPAW_03G262100 [Carya illinoinensis]
MSKKRDKGKQIVPAPPPPVSTKPAPPVEIANRFTTLGSIYQPASFASTVSTPYDPYAKPIASATARPTQLFLPASKTQYIKKMYSWNLFYIESNRSIDTDPYKIATRYFPPNFHWIPENPAKNLQFYSSILIHTDSLTIKPIYDKTDDSKLIYHSAYILRFITEEDWGTHPSTSKKLRDSEITYNYYDYIDAWFRFMLFQTPDMSHSWFFNFDKNFRGKIPLWFNKWWHQFGLIPDIFPEELQRAYKSFIQAISSKLDAYESKFPYCVHFSKRFKPPWILKWSYEKNGDILHRFAFVKWWDRFPHMANMINTISKEFGQTTLNLKNSEDFPTIDRSAPKYPLIQAPTSSTTSKKKATISSSQKSVQSSKSKKKNISTGLTKKDLIHLLQQSLKEDSSDPESEASSEASYSNTFGHDSEDTPRLSDD